MSQLKETNATLAFYSDFKKISKHVNDIAISLNALNYLIGKKNLREAVEALWKRDPKAFEVMDILIATRKQDKKMFFDEKGELRLIHSLFQNVDGIMEFLEGTGLADVFRNSETMFLVLRPDLIPMPAKTEAEILWKVWFPACFPSQA